MSELAFTYGLMGAGKSAAAIDRIIELRAQHTIIPALTGRSRAKRAIVSRDGREIPASVVDENDRITSHISFDLYPHTIVVDEAQFLAPGQIATLRTLATAANINVECFGLLTDFRQRLFPGSKRLVEVADSLIKLPGVECARCEQPGRINARIDSAGQVAKDGPQVLTGDLGSQYAVLCNGCYSKPLVEAVEAVMEPFQP